MQIKTKYLGDVEITEEDILHFPNGLLGFENRHEFIFLNIPGNEHFKVLQDINNSFLAFLLINPWDFFKDYEIDILDEDLAKLGIDSNQKDKLGVYNIITLGSTLQKSTANLLAPILINTGEKIGKQYILNDSSYSTKHRLFPEGLGE